MAMDAPSMVQRSGDTLIVRSVVSGDQIFFDKETGKVVHSSPDDRFNPSESTLGLNSAQSEMPEELELPNTVKEEGLPQCKIKRNYSCNTCTFFTQNPRYFLTHLRDVHGEKIVINDCKLCLYASRHYQKLVRHMKMVHGSTEGIEDHAQARKRQLGRESRKRKIEEAIPNASLACQAVLAPVGKFEDTIAEEIPQNRLLKCSLCEFTTLYRAQLVEHEQDEHCKTKFFRCEKCTYVTHIKARFSKHVKYHSMPMIKCVTCDFRTPYKWNLDRHMKNHGGSGPFRCAACNFTADIKQSLTVHEMNHHVPPVGHAAGMSMARRKNKVGGTDIVEDFLSENGDLEDHLNNNNNIDDFDETLTKKYKYESDEQPTDLSQKSFQDSYNQNRKAVRPVPNLIPIQTAGAVLNLSKHFKELQAEKTQINELASFLLAENQISEILKSDKIEQPQLSPSSSGSATSKRKSVNFFDRLKETLPTDTDLICVCGHVSKCLSESLIHRNTCRRDDVEEKRLSASPINLSVNSGSTRCQYCRHRCKSSADLASHMKNCTEVGQCQNDSYDSLSDINDRHDEDGCDQNAEGSCKHPMENRIFVWNKLPGVKGDRYAVDQDGVNADYERSRTVNLNNENGYFGVETAPGYGEMTAEDEAANSSLKKVYKCPHCSFWASTASRFHVHIVGHLNKKPFECSFCAYRSNWRWDITKHIRLKTIRDPNHKIARVLMNDETGRRNYTKYNKYITLMKVTEEDGDPKLLKSGEMTPHQEASLAFINEYGNSMLKSKFSEGNMEDMKLHDAGTSASKTSLAANPNRFMKLPFFPTPMMGIMSSHKEQKEVVKRSPPPLIKATEDLIAQNIDIKQDGAEKRTLYKCKQCNYRNSSRDMVLSHVKEHFQEFGMNLNQNSNMPNSLQAAVNSNFYMKNMLAAMCLSSQQLSIVDKQGKLQQHSHLAGPLIPPSQHVLDSSTKPVLGTTNSSVAPLNLGITTKANEHGEVDEASSGVVTTTGTGVTGWRNPAPYRCGHCHQVSNWKHVIQRHCRLKHNSDIRIETVDRTSNKRSPTYHPLMTPSTCSSTNALSSAANSSQNNIKLTSASSQEAIHSQTSTKTPVSSSSCDQEDNMIADMSAAKTFDSHTEPEASEKSKQKQHQCSSCSFVSESKSQMNYHVSLLHKNNLECYECHICCFPAINKQQLAHHIKISHGEGATGAEAIDLRAKNSKENDVLEKFAYFCHECPARYFGKKELTAHIKMHSEKFAYNCKFCSYSSRQEHDLLAHAVMHSDGYQDKTEKLCIKFKANSKHSRPKLKQLVLSAEENIWIVDRFSNSSNDLEDSIQKNIIDLGECNSFKPKSLLQAQLESSDKLELLPNDSFVGERCPDCPFETLNKEDYKTHIQCHLRISNRCEKFQCSCCDFSVPDEALLKEHMHLHVLPIFGSKSVNFYTRYDKLELNIVNGSESGGEYENVYRCDDERSSDDLDDGFAEDNPPNSRIILNAATGEIINSRDETPSANPF